MESRPGIVHAMTKPRIVTVDDLYGELAHYTCTEHYYYQPFSPWMKYTYRKVDNPNRGKFQF